MLNGWRYYNHAWLPQCAPHEDIDASRINSDFWKQEGNGYSVLARWTSDWDCGFPTEWWYCIKDTPFDMEALKQTRRYKVRRGERNFRVVRINPMEYIDALFEVQVAAFSVYPSAYRPQNLTKEDLIEDIRTRKNQITYGAFSKKNDALCGYVFIHHHGSYAELLVQKADPKAERDQVNAALVKGVLDDLRDCFDGRFYLVDGERNINHQTNFQEYLIKYFGFRKAYCKLNIAYRPWVGLFIKMMYPFSSMLQNFDDLKYIHMLNALLKMERIARSFR